MKEIIRFFAEKHLFANFFFLAILIGGVVFWGILPREELPEMTLDFVQVRVMYPGASAEEVEHFVTWPIEEELRSVNGIEEIRSTSSEGTCNISLELEKDIEEQATVIGDIRNSVLSVDLPSEIRDTPVMRQFKSSRKAIIDVAVYMENKEFLNDKDRKILQTYSHALENRLLGLEQVNSITMHGYLTEELQVRVNPARLERYRLPLSTLSNEIQDSSVRRPAGSLKNVDKERVIIDAEINAAWEMRSLPIQGNFEGNLVRVGDIASVVNTFEENNDILKANGREAVIMNIRKNSSYGIIDTVDAVKQEVSNFRSAVLKNTSVKVVLLDDESRDVRNRISIIGSNGLIGFICILVLLFIFLNLQSGFWVAMGIPFTFSFTMIIAGMYGYTINNMTLAAVIIVMGMIVDDAIIVSENIMRLRSQGVPMKEAAVEGTTYVMLPITASVLTTCAAFLPLLAFEGRLSLLTDVIPPLVGLMLLASLIESVIVLPAHLSMKVPRLIRIVSSLGLILLVEKYIKKRATDGNHDADTPREHWFHAIERRYSRLLARLLHHRWVILLIFIVLLTTSVLLMKEKMHFAIFPREETTEIMLIVEAPEGTPQEETARLAGKAEEVFREYLGKEVIGFRTNIGQTMHRASARENMFRMRVELVQPEEREKSLNILKKEWTERLEKIGTFKSFRFAAGRFGTESGSPLEVVVIENDNRKRREIAGRLAETLRAMPELKNVEIGEPYHSPEYRLSIKRDLVKRIGVDASEIGQTVRTILEGTILYELIQGDEEKNVRVTMPDYMKQNMNAVMKMPVVNNAGYLLPLGDVVHVEKTSRPSEIQRLDHQRTVMVYADLAQDTNRTPIEMAELLERQVFPEFTTESPSTSFRFDGEVKFTRESSKFFPVAVVMTLLLIYIILALQFNSVYRPLTVMLTIPPAAASVVFVYWFHGMDTFGFFGVIGILGLAGVVVNDAIVLLKKLDDEFNNDSERAARDGLIADIASTRVRAVLLTTITTVAGLFPTAYGIAGYDSMLAEMMLALAWGLVFGTLITLVLVPAMYSLEKQMVYYFRKDNRK